MKNTGGLLRAKREEANLSLSEVALATKINPKVLLAIEAGESDRLPAKTFLKGFVRSYALYLKTDVDAVMAIFTEETGGAPAPTIHEAYLKPEEGAVPARRGPPAEESHAGMRTVAVAVIALLILAIVGVRELIEKYQREKVVAAPDVRISPLGPAADKPDGKPEAKAETKVAEPRTPEPKIPEAKAPEPAKKAEAKPEPAAAKPVAAEIPPKAAPGPSQNEVILEATAKVNVDFRVHGEGRHLTLGPDDVHTIRAGADLQVDVSDGGAVNVILNGVDRGPAGAPGKPAQVKIP